MYEDFAFEGYYAFICTDSPNSAEKRQQVRSEHVARLKALEKEGRLLIAGPLLDNNEMGMPTGGLIIAKFASLAEAQKWMEQEPYVASGAYQKVELRTYKNIFGFQGKH